MSGIRYREVVVQGAPREMGRQLGEAAKEEVRGFCEVGLHRALRTVAMSPERAYAIAEQCLPLADAYQPDHVEELRGVADAAGVSLLDLMVVQIRNQLRVEADAGCTSLSIAAGPNQPAILAQNWDNDPALDAFTIVLTRKPEGKPAFMSVTQAGLIAYIGLSEAGIGCCLNTLPAPSRTVGVPHYFTLRGIYESTSLDEAVEAVRRARRAIPANIMMATPQGPADLEITVDDVHVLRPDGRNWITHTNHCQHPDLCAINDDFPELIESHPRKNRIDELLSETEGPISIRQVKGFLCDHDNHPRSICRHQNEDETTGTWQTVFSVVISPAQRRMHITRGTPCNRPYERYEF